MDFILKHKKTKKNVEIAGVSMEEMNGDNPVIYVYVDVQGKNDTVTREKIEFVRDPSVSVEDFESAETEDFIFSKEVSKKK